MCGCILARLHRPRRTLNVIPCHNTHVAGLKFLYEWDKGSDFSVYMALIVTTINISSFRGPDALYWLPVVLHGYRNVIYTRSTLNMGK